MTFTRKKKEGGNKEKDGREREKVNGGLVRHREDKFRSRLLNADVIFTFNGFARQADSYICDFPNLLYERCRCLSGSDGKLASVRFC